jgi:hypothetical protein
MADATFRVEFNSAEIVKMVREAIAELKPEIDALRARAEQAEAEAARQCLRAERAETACSRWTLTGGAVRFRGPVGSVTEWMDRVGCVQASGVTFYDADLSAGGAA